MFVTGLAGLFWLDEQYAGWALFPLVVIVALLGAQEMIRLATVDLGTPPDAAIGGAESRLMTQPMQAAVYLGTLLVVASNGVPLFWRDYPANCPVGKLGWPAAAFAVAMMFCFVAEFIRYEKPFATTINLALTVFSIAYLGMLSFAIQLRITPDREWGLLALVSLLVTVKMGDVGAYTVGRLIGRHKMAPKLSPGKTWEGFCGGVAAAALSAWLVFEYLGPLLVGAYASGDAGPPWGVLLYGALIGIAGVVGDLAESLMKRSAGLKDSSAWMPGFGGVLDLLDSILLAAPVAYICWVLELVGPG